MSLSIFAIDFLDWAGTWAWDLGLGLVKKALVNNDLRRSNSSFIGLKILPKHKI